MIITKENEFFLVKIYQENLSDFDIFDKDSISELFQSILVKLKKKYDIKGLMEVEVFVNPNYGMIIEIHPIYSYFDEVDMRIQVHLNSIFMCEIDSNDLLNFYDVYYYKDKFYAIYTKFVDSQVIYKESEEIIEKGIKVC